MWWNFFIFSLFHKDGKVWLLVESFGNIVLDLFSTFSSSLMSANIQSGWLFWTPELYLKLLHLYCCIFFFSLVFPKVGKPFHLVGSFGLSTSLRMEGSSTWLDLIDILWINGVFPYPSHTIITYWMITISFQQEGYIYPSDYFFYPRKLHFSHF